MGLYETRFDILSNVYVNDDGILSVTEESEKQSEFEFQELENLYKF